jgi:hypothetical protein
MCPSDLLRSVRFLLSLVWFQVSLFRSTVVIISDGCCCGVLVLWDLSTTTSRLSTTTSSTTTSFPGFGDGGARTAARLRLALVFVVVARWSSDLFVIFFYFWDSLYCCWWLLIDRWNFRKKMDLRIIVGLISLYFFNSRIWDSGVSVQSIWFSRTWIKSTDKAVCLYKI